MPAWTNRAVFVLARNGTTSHTIDPSSALGLVAGAAFTPTAGRLLLIVVGGAVTSTTPSGWTLPANGSAINNTGLYVWHRTAVAGSNTASATHNGSNYAIAAAVYEFPAGTTFVKAISAINVTATAANPALTGLTGTNLVMAVKATAESGTVGSDDYAWTGTGSPIEDWQASADGSPTDGFLVSLAHVEAYTGASWQPTGTLSWTTGPTNEALTFAVALPAGGTGGTLTVVAGDAAAAGGSTSYASGAAFSAAGGDAAADGAVVAFAGGSALSASSGTADAAGGTVVFASGARFAVAAADAAAEGGLVDFGGGVSGTLDADSGSSDAAGAAVGFVTGGALIVSEGSAAALGGDALILTDGVLPAVAGELTASGELVAFSASAPGTMSVASGDASAVGGLVGMTAGALLVVAASVATASGDSVAMAFVPDVDPVPVPVMEGPSIPWPARAPGAERPYSPRDMRF